MLLCTGVRSQNPRQRPKQSMLLQSLCVRCGSRTLEPKADDQEHLPRLEAKHTPPGAVARSPVFNPVDRVAAVVTPAPIHGLSTRRWARRAGRQRAGSGCDHENTEHDEQQAKSAHWSLLSKPAIEADSLHQRQEASFPHLE